jgi:hypothetical protein
MPSTSSQLLIPLLSCLLLAGCWKQAALAPDPLARHPREVRVTTASGSQVISMPRIENDTLRGVLPGGPTVDSVSTPMAAVLKLEVPAAGASYAQFGVLLGFVAILIGIGVGCAYLWCD